MNKKNIETIIKRFENPDEVSLFEKGKFEKVGKPNEHFSQFVAVAADGTPWMTCAPSGSNTVYRGEK